MCDINRMILDELMGKDRNVPLKELHKKKSHYNDESVSSLQFVTSPDL